MYSATLGKLLKQFCITGYDDIYKDSLILAMLTVFLNRAIQKNILYLLSQLELVFLNCDTCKCRPPVLSSSRAASTTLHCLQSEKLLKGRSREKGGPVYSHRPEKFR